MAHLYLGHIRSSCSGDQQRRQWNREKGDVRGVSTISGEVSSSCSFPLPFILVESTGDGEGDGVSYEETGPSSSKDEGGGGGDNREEGGERSSVSKLWQMMFQSCCVIYSAMNARGMT